MNEWNLLAQAEPAQAFPWGAVLSTLGITLVGLVPAIVAWIVRSENKHKADRENDAKKHADELQALKELRVAELGIGKGMTDPDAKARGEFYTQVWALVTEHKSKITTLESKQLETEKHLDDCLNEKHANDTKFALLHQSYERIQEDHKDTIQQLSDLKSRLDASGIRPMPQDKHIEHVVKLIDATPPEPEKPELYIPPGSTPSWQEDAPK